MIKEIPLRHRDAEILDGESNRVNLDTCYDIRGNELESALKSIKHIHGATVRFLPLSAASAGGGVFQMPTPAGETIIGLHIAATVMPNISLACDVDIRKINLDEIIINEHDFSIYAGAAITLEQLNQALHDELGPQFNVLGADLTSYTYAQVGSTFMTGGMGPQRCYFSDSVVEIALHDGDEIVSIDGDDLLNYAGTYGWTGLVSAVKCIFYELPVEEFAFSIPVKNTPEDLAKVLNHFAGFAYLEKSTSTGVRTKNGDTTIITGLEHITVGSMQPLLNTHTNNGVTNIAREIVDKCESADADGMIFVYGLSDFTIDHVLGELIDDLMSPNLTIADINLDYTYNFANLFQMQELREAVSYAARNQHPKGLYSYKGHTDANIRVNPDKLKHSVNVIWQAYLDYIQCVENFFNSKPSVHGEILVYGHLNPSGFDPHNRITFATDDEPAYLECVEVLDEFKKTLILELAKICQHTGCVFIGGEKGVGSDHELLSAFDVPEAVPDKLLNKYLKQKNTISKASVCFNWRAFEPYV